MCVWSRSNQWIGSNFYQKLFVVEPRYLSNEDICARGTYVWRWIQSNMSSWTWCLWKVRTGTKWFSWSIGICANVRWIFGFNLYIHLVSKKQNGVSFWVVGKQLKTKHRSSSVTCFKGVAVICSRFCRKHPILSTGFRSCFKINMVLANNKLQTIDAKQCRAFNVAWFANHDRRFFIHVRFNPIVDMSFQTWKLNLLDFFTTQTNKLHSNRNVQWHFRIGSVETSFAGFPGRWLPARTDVLYHQRFGLSPQNVEWKLPRNMHSTKQQKSI